jgi:hypothetical protein
LFITLAVITLQVKTGNAQVPDVANLANFEEIDRDEDIIYFINVKNAVWKDSVVTLDAMGANYRMDADGVGFALNNIAYIVTTFRIDCGKRTGTRLRDKGKWPKTDGTVETINETFTNSLMEKPGKSRKLHVVIEAVCKQIIPDTSVAILVSPLGNPRIPSDRVLDRK